MKYLLTICTIVASLAVPVSAQQTTEQTTTNAEPGVIQENDALIQQNAEPGSETQAIINQQNTIIHHHPTPTPEPVITNEHLTVSVTDNLVTVRPGEEITYRITLRNHLHQDLNDILIRFEVPRYMIPSTTEPEANTTDPARRVIEWKQQQISAGSEVSYILRGHAELGAPNRAELVAKVLVNGPGIHQTAQDLTTMLSGAIAGIATTPAPTAAIIDVRPTAKTGSATVGLVLGLITTTTGIFTTKRLLSIS